MDDEIKRGIVTNQGKRSTLTLLNNLMTVCTGTVPIINHYINNLRKLNIQHKSIVLQKSALSIVSHWF